MKKRKYILNILNAVIVLTAVIILSVALYPSVSDYVNALSQTRTIAKYIDEVMSLNDDEAKALLEEARAYNESLRLKPDRFKFTAEETAEYKKLLNTGRGVIGILVVDKIGVKLPIYHGTDEAVLQVGVGHLHGSSLPVGGAGTHSIITGHTGLPSSTLLTNLDRLNEGDTFMLHVLGETLTYQVDQIRIVEPDKMQTLEIEKDMDYCTLVTCTPYGVNSHRLLVRGHRIENAPNSNWEAIYADARRLDKLIVILIFMLPLIPVLLILIVMKCRKIKRRGNVCR